MFGAKLSWCQIVRCQIVLVPNCPGAKLSTFIILVPNCPLLLSWCQIVPFIILVPNCPVPNCPVPNCPTISHGGRVLAGPSNFVATFSFSIFSLTGLSMPFELMIEHFSLDIWTLKMRIRMTLNIQKTEVTSGIFGVRGWDEPSAQQDLTSVQSTKEYKYKACKFIRNTCTQYIIQMRTISYQMQ